MSILIYTENFEGKFKKSTFELASYGNEIAKRTGTEVVAITIGKVSIDALNELGKYGVQKVLVVKNSELNDFSVKAYSVAIEQAAKAVKAEVIIFGNNPSGRAIAPNISVKLNAGLAPGVVDLPSSIKPFTVRKKAYSGKVTVDFVISTDIKVLTLTQNSYKVIESETEISISNFDVNIPAGLYNAKPIKTVMNTGKLSVTDADVLVSGGRGLKGPENWKMVEEMAEILNAATCCSRPVSDLEWRPHHEHVGQTGKVVAPDLYIALGISGAVQHLAGVNGSKVIVAINTDADAPIFEAADYGIIGDVLDVVPKLNTALRQFKGK